MYFKASRRRRSIKLIARTESKDKMDGHADWTLCASSSSSRMRQYANGLPNTRRKRKFHYVALDVSTFLISSSLYVVINLQQ